MTIHGRAHIVLKNYNFGDAKIKPFGLTDTNALEKLDKYVVVGEHTVFAGKYQDDDEERVVWVDAEGLGYGWGFMQFMDENEEIDYEAVANKFKERKDKDMELYRNLPSGRAYVMQEGDKYSALLLIDEEDMLGEENYEVTNKIYMLSPTIEQELETNYNDSDNEDEDESDECDYGEYEEYDY